MLKRLVAQELVLSFVPDAEQRLWRTVTRRKNQLTRDKVRFQNQLESLLEQAHIKLSSLVSDLLGVSARRMLKAIAEGETDPAALAALADYRLRATPEQLRDALGAWGQLHGVYRRLLKMALEELKLMEEQIEPLEQEASKLLQQHQNAVQRVAAVPGFGVDSALKGNRTMRRLLNQAAHAAIKVKGSIFEVTFRRLLLRLKYQQAIWAIAHRLCRLLWKILHEGVRYEERGPAVSAKSKRTRTARMIKELKALGYRVEGGPLPAGTPA